MNKGYPDSNHQPLIHKRGLFLVWGLRRVGRERNSPALELSHQSTTGLCVVRLRRAPTFSSSASRDCPSLSAGPPPKMRGAGRPSCSVLDPEVSLEPSKVGIQLGVRQGRGQQADGL